MAVETRPKGKRSRVRGTPKGRAVDPTARQDVRALLGDAPRRRDLLIEHLHKIQDRYGHLSAAHLVALAAENARAEADARAYGVSSTMKALSAADTKILQALASTNMKPEQLIAFAFQELAGKADKIGQLNISPDLLRELLAPQPVRK